MYHLRGLLTVLCFVTLSAVAVAAAVQAISYGIPETLASNASVLIGALASEDVSPEPRMTKLKYGQRVQRELYANIDWSSELAALDAAQRERFLNNVTALAKASVDHKVEQYFQLPEGRRRDRFLDRQIDEMLNWVLIVNSAAQSGDEAALGQVALPNLRMLVNSAYGSSSPDEIVRLNQFLQALQERAFKGNKRRFRPMGG